MSPFGTLAVAAHALCQRIERVVFMPGMGFGMAAGVLAGQNLGAGQPERAERGCWLAVAVVQSFMAICAVAILIWSENITHIFTTEPDLVKTTVIFLKIAVAGYLTRGFAAVLMQSLNGIGDTIVPMLATLLQVWLVQVPMAFVLTRFTDFGAYGVRWAIVAGMVAAALTFVIYFKLGRWKRKKV